ncbi:MAG: M3 family metallopeptidase, partial [Deltaproteobacteria bacterium]|nr:M3 family metallopeptidase [Deltaproteobacteria bacterium]
MNNNPLLSKNTNRNNTVPFDKIRIEHFIPAITEQVKISEKKVEGIKSNPESPSFNNTMVELEKVIEEFNSLFSIYFMLFGVESDDELKELDEKISPMEAEFFSKLYTDDILFNRILEVNTNYFKFNLNQEDKRLLDITYNKFVRNGALLNIDDKKKINEIDKELSTLGGKFSTNVLKRRNEYQLYITDRERLSGIPENLVKLAEETALKKGKESGWILTLSESCVFPILNYADDRELRREIHDAFRKGNIGGEYDNSGNILNILRLKKERASLLGYETYSHYIVDDYMAEKPERINSFLEDIYSASLPVAKNEIEELKAIAYKLDGIDDFQIYDQLYYSEKLKKEKYSFDNEILRPYFKLENVVNGIFEVANKLFDITFKEVTDIPVYHKDVRTFEVLDSELNIIGVFYMDSYSRETKRDGAWMLSLIEQSNIEGVNKIPHVLVACNFTPPSKGTPSLLTYMEVETLFHEFGHALHGLLSKITFASLSGTNVLHDYVELPSKIMENWFPEKETLSLFAKHYKTGEIIPDDLME